MHLMIGEQRRLDQPDTFAHDTLIYRLPKMLDALIKDQPWNAETKEKLNQIHQVFPHRSPVQFIDDGPSNEEWNRRISTVKHKTFLEIPIIFSECYFYRKILEATGYFKTGSPFYHFDPFHYKKEPEFEENLRLFQQLIDCFEEEIVKTGFNGRSLEALFRLNLTGNQADLSTDHPELENTVSMERLFKQVLLINDAPAIMPKFRKKMRQIDIITDNAGVELFCDFLMADYFLRNSMAARVIFHLKPYPIFVSDAMTGDVKMLLDFLHRNMDANLICLGERIDNYFQTGQIVSTEFPFWNLPVNFREVKTSLEKEFGGSELVICKGDANYRRFFDDLIWPDHSEPAEILTYFPAPVLFLRIIKSEVLAAEMVVDRDILDKTFRQWPLEPHGMIQYSNKD